MLALLMSSLEESWSGKRLIQILVIGDYTGNPHAPSSYSAPFPFHNPAAPLLLAILSRLPPHFFHFCAVL